MPAIKRFVTWLAAGLTFKAVNTKEQKASRNHGNEKVRGLRVASCAACGTIPFTILKL